MVTDSSSGTLPSSSRLTIDSSSSSARSKLSFLTSAWVFSVMLRSRMRCLASELKKYLCGCIATGICAHQCADMGRDRLLQALKIIAALEHRDNSSSRGSFGGIHQLARDPAEVFGLEIERGQRIAIMRVETGRDDDQLGTELGELRQDHVLERGAKFRAAILRRQGRVDDIVVFAAFTFGAVAGKQRHLVRRAIHHALVSPEDVLGAVAVVNVEVDHGGAADAVFALGMPGGDGGVVEKAKTHRLVGFRVIGRRGGHPAERYLGGRQR